MRIVPTSFSGLFVLEPERVADERGYFARTYCEASFSQHRLETRFVQAGTAFNFCAGTVRGLHYQRAPHEETKLIRCTSGKVHDVVLDVRPNSPTYLSLFEITLSQENGLSLYVPGGYAHGYQTLHDGSELSYSMSTNYQPDAAAGICWNDPAIRLAWPLPISVISNRDRTWPLIGTSDSGLPLRNGVGRK